MEYWTRYSSVSMLCVMALMRLFSSLFLTKLSLHSSHFKFFSHLPFLSFLLFLVCYVHLDLRCTEAMCVYPCVLCVKCVGQLILQQNSDASGFVGVLVIFYILVLDIKLGLVDDKPFVFSDQLL